MSIQVWSYLDEYRELREDILAEVDKVFQSGRLILGDSVSNFEQSMAAWCGMRYGVGVNSGTDALFLGLKALGIREGDEVITVANTAVPTVSAIVSAGGVPRFVDIEPDTYLMDVRQLEDALTPRTRAVLPVHLYGQCVDMQPLMAFAAKHDLKVLEDCAQSTGALYQGKKAGSLGHMSAFSFYPTKLLGGYGDGGMVLSNEEAMSDKLKSLRMYGMKGIYYAEEHGYNSRLDEVQAAILALKLRYLDGWIDRRRQLANQYQSMLGDVLKLPVEAPGNRHAWYVYVARHPDRDRIIEELKKKDILLNISYPWPISIMRGYSHLGYGEGDLPVTESAAKEIFSLPMYPQLTDEDQETVCNEIRSIAG
ncbi:MAG: DegT/DnrJ/EryC1/StrS family aminotransferase [Thiogranum sp.]|nr:DegT/DnrJ/EryC1/StrS family aminotransferase [Thiogranum sp.]